MIVLIFGATGSAGGSVLRVCLADPDVTEVRVIVRRPTGLTDPKLRQIIHRDYLVYESDQATFTGVDACFYCLGKSVGQVSGEGEYRMITYEFAMAAAQALHHASPAAVFHYVSGGGTSRTSQFMWARVKAEAEGDLMFRFGAVCWRPGSIDGVASASEPFVYKLFRPLSRVLLQPFPSAYVKGRDLGRAMLVATRGGARKRIFENAEIRKLAKQYRDR